MAWAADGHLDGTATTGFATGNALLLAGEDAVFGWRVAEDSLDPAGCVDADAVVSVFGGDDAAYAFSEAGDARILSMTLDDGLVERGVVNLPGDWEPMFPYGRPCALGNGGPAVVRRLDRRGFNVLRLRQGAYRPGEA